MSRTKHLYRTHFVHEDKRGKLREKLTKEEMLFDDLEELDDNNRVPARKLKGQTETKAEGKTMSAQVVEGIVNFSHITEHDTYMGQDTGAYSMTVTLSEDDAAALASQGVKIKDYQGNQQRKFKSKYDVKVFDAEGNRYSGEVPYNSKVRLKYKLGPAHPVHGVSTYLDAVKVIEEADMPEGSDDF